VRHWILQANPRRYRLFDALRDGYEISSWSVVHLRDEIAAGAEFALWVSGEERGVYALGVVTEPAEDRQPAMARPSRRGRLGRASHPQRHARCRQRVDR
jgi:hypothetical protein